eukprot:424285_1
MKLGLLFDLMKASLLIILIDLAHGYLNMVDIIALNELYVAFNGKYWTGCQWNMTLINNTSHSNYLNDDCSLYFNNYTSTTNYQYLQKINFYLTVSNVTGSIPTAIGNLSHLAYIKLFYTDLYGSLPNEICQLTKLTHLAIVGNHFTGTIPSCLFDLEHINYLSFSSVPHLSLNTSNIEQLCNNSYMNLQLKWLQIFAVNYSGSVPSCIGYNLTNLDFLQFVGLDDLTGVIPASINNMKSLTKIYLTDLTSISTESKTYINFTALNNVTEMELDFNFIDVNFEDLCHLHLRKLLLTNYNQNNSIHISNECIFNSNNNLTQLEISGGFTGLIDETICTQKYIQRLQIHDTNIDINIPECFSEFNQLIKFTLTHNKKVYSLAKNALNSSNLNFVTIRFNENLGGSISHLLTNASFSELQILAVDNNNFYDTNINNLLFHLFKYSKKLIVLTLHNNDYLSGSIPHIDGKINLDNIQIITLQNLDIYGSVPNNLYLSQNVSSNDLKVLTLYGNRLCDAVPDHLFSINNNNKNSFNITMFPGNKFTVLQEQNNNWLNLTLFYDAKSLYISTYDNVISYMITIAALIAALMCITMLLYTNKSNYKDNKQDSNIADYFFLFNLKQINILLLDKYLIIFAIILSIFYSMNSNYYIYNVFLAKFSLYNFYSDNIIINIILSIFIIIYNIIIIFKVIQINDSKQQYKYDIVRDPNKIKNKCVQIFVSIFYIILYMVIIGLVFFYGIFLSLPS